jgi:large subunit ribosomal protein L5
MSVKDKYNKETVSDLKKIFGFTNNLQAPRVNRVVVNVGTGKFLKDANTVKEIVDSVQLITGQKPVLTKAKKSIAGFKIREGLEVGVKVTLRGKRRWDFIERLVGAAIPRVRDFQGIKESAVDENGNFNLGIKEHMIFPEILPENVKTIFSLQVNIVTTARNHKEGLELFKALKFPMKISE